ELPVDAATREPHVVCREDHVVLVDTQADLLGTGGEAGELLQRPSRDDRVEIRACSLEARLLDGESVRVGCGHDQLVALEADENACQNRARLVTRGGPSDLLDRRQQCW